MSAIDENEMTPLKPSNDYLFSPRKSRQANTVFPQLGRIVNALCVLYTNMADERGADEEAASDVSASPDTQLPPPYRSSRCTRP